MPTVQLTSHLHEFFGNLRGTTTVEGATVREVIDALEAMAPGFAFYVCDEVGRLRQHVLIYVDGVRTRDRATLGDAVQPGSQVLIVQALSGG